MRGTFGLRHVLLYIGVWVSVQSGRVWRSWCMRARVSLCMHAFMCVYVFVSDTVYEWSVTRETESEYEVPWLQHSV